MSKPAQVYRLDPGADEILHLQPNPRPVRGEPLDHIQAFSPENMHEACDAALEEVAQEFAMRQGELMARLADLSQKLQTTARRSGVSFTEVVQTTLKRHRP